MSREEQIQEYESKQLIDELSKMPPMVISTAYLHAINYTLFGLDVTEKWLTATQNASALKKAYREGYHDALQRQAEGSKERIDAEVLDRIRAELHATAEMHEDGDYYLREEWIDEIFDKYKMASPTGEDSTCDDCKTPCVMYEKGMRGCKTGAESEG